MLRKLATTGTEEVFYKKAVLNNFAIFSGKHLCPSVFLGSPFYEKETPTQVFSSEYCEIFNKTYLIEHLQTAAAKIH